jgi:hypothetical protein
VLPAYKVYFDDQLANKFKPIVYSHECLSGDPEGLYYRIVKRVDGEELYSVLLLLVIPEVHGSP